MHNYEHVGETIVEANKIHDEQITKITEKKVEAATTNAAVKKEVLFDILKADAAGEDVEQVVEDAHLPFEVTIEEEPSIELNNADAAKTLNRIVKRNQNTDPEVVKEDPEFDRFLSQVIDGFQGATQEQKQQARNGARRSQASQQSLGAIQQKLRNQYQQVPDYYSDEQQYLGYNPYEIDIEEQYYGCLLYTSPSPRDLSTSRMPSSA